MSIEVLVPQLPESVADATLITWNKAVGDVVEKNDTLIDLETDKVILEVPAPASGILTQILKENDTLVVSGEVLALIDPQGEASEPSETVNNESEKTTDIPLSPAVRRLINEHHLDPHQITGSGKDGRLTKTDVLDFINEPKQQTTNTAPKPIAVEKNTPDLHKISDSVKPEGARPEQRVPMTRLRAKIAERLLEAQQNAAMLTTFNEVNMKNVMELRQQYKDRFLAKHEVKLGFMSFFVKASIEALKRFPIVNASIDQNDIIYHGYYDIGIAVSTERGLVVPILKDVDRLDFAGIEKSIINYGTKAREGSLGLDDLMGGTFTITNGGTFGSMLSTPLLNPPQSAILGMHAIKERAVVENGEIVIRPIMYLALSYDHRLVDGRDAVQFLGMIKECLESPAHLLLNI